MELGDKKVYFEEQRSKQLKYNFLGTLDLGC